MANSREDKTQISFWITAAGERNLAHLVADLKYERRHAKVKPTREMVLEELVTLCSKIPAGRFGDLEDFIRGLSLPLQPPVPPEEGSAKYSSLAQRGKKRA